MSIRLRDENAADRPEIGTPLAAVETCVSLIAGMFSQPESVVAYCLDLYYQTRRHYEQAEGDEAPVLIRAEDLLPALRRLWLEVLSGTEPQPPTEPEKKPVDQPPEPEPPQTAPAKAAQAAPKFDPPSPEDKAAAAAAREAAKFKQETRARLTALREKGLTLAQIREASGGKLPGDRIMSILECKPVDVRVYRVLAAALDKIAAAEPPAGAEID